jgi:hypothetical protein
MELLCTSTHLLDTILSLLDARAAFVSGHVTGETEDVDSLEAASAVDVSGGGSFVGLDEGTFPTVDCTVPRNHSSMMLSFVGSAGTVYEQLWRKWRLAEGEHVETSLPGIDGEWGWDVDFRNAFPDAAEHGVDLLDGEATNRSTGEAAKRSLEIIAGFYIPHHIGGHVDVPLERPLRDVPITAW